MRDRRWLLDIAHYRIAGCTNSDMGSGVCCRFALFKTFFFNHHYFFFYSFFDGELQTEDKDGIDDISSTKPTAIPRCLIEMCRRSAGAP